MSSFELNLSSEEKGYLKNLAFLSIKSALDGTDPEYPVPPDPKLDAHLGAFVTLKINGRLRGCIGHIIGDRPVWKTIIRMAREAAFGDPRFPRLKSTELELLEIEISILSPLEQITDLSQIEPGKHGLLVRKGALSGLLLPQVAREWGWDRSTFLAHTCQKAGLPPDCFENDFVEIYRFQAEVF